MISSSDPPETMGNVLLRHKNNWCILEINRSPNRYYIGHLHSKKTPRISRSGKLRPFRWYYVPIAKCRICKKRAPRRVRLMFKLLKL